MQFLRWYGPILGFWLLAATAATGVTMHGQSQERDQLFERFQNRSDTGSSFVGAYVQDIFKNERRLGAEVSAATWRPSQFASSISLLGFPTGVLLDRAGRAVAMSPRAPELAGTRLASDRYPHLSAALAGRPTVSDVVPSTVAGKPTVAFTVPLPTGRYRVLSLGFDLAEGPLQAFLERPPIRGTRGYILDSSGATIAAAGDGPAVVTPSRLTIALDRPTVVDGRLLAATPIPGTPWTYMLDAPEDAVLAPLTADDRSQWVLLTALALLTLGGLLVAGRTLAARGQARAEQAEADHRLRLTVEHAPVGMTMLGLDHRFIEPNAHLCSMLGYSGEELAALTLEEVTHADDMDLASLAQLTAGEIESYEREQRHVRRDGTPFWGRFSVSVVRDAEGETLYYVVQIVDVTESRATQAELEYRALYDPLTGLANRSLLMDRLTVALPGSRRPGHVGIGFCDVDNFKQINDTFGHHAGDEVLKEVAQRLRNSVRAGDTVARMGGDEFILLLTEVDSLLEAERAMERASQAIAQPFEVDGLTLTVGLSRGLALSHSGVSAETLLRNADAALYAAKKSGRGGCVVYHALLDGVPHHNDRTSAPIRNQRLPAHPGKLTPEDEGSRLERVIREAIDGNGVQVAYQPVFDLSNGMLVGAEALLRLTDRAGRAIPPLQVVPAAEASGQIVEIGRRVLQMAAAQSAKWREQHGLLLPVAVNVSAAQLGLPGFPAHVLDAVEQAGVPPEALVIELTESVMLRTGSGGVKQLGDLCDAGIELAIDDFGTGYASLSLLHELPAATLKIDQSFISGIPGDPRAVAVVAGVIDLARNLGMYCIAEGIETEVQRDYLIQRGVLGQGYLLGRPDDQGEIGRILARDGMGDPWGRREPQSAFQAGTPATPGKPLHS